MQGLTMVEFRILGAITLRREDGNLDHSFLAGPKRLGLLTYLVLARPRGYQRRDKLVALFWPEQGQKSARNALSNMLYQIREVLGKQAVESRGTEEVCINPERVWCDAVAFEKTLDEGELQKALELYHGNLLPGFHVGDVSNEFMSWLDSERQRLRGRLAVAAWHLTEQAEKAGNLTYARRWAKKAVSYSEFSEDTYQRLIAFLRRISDYRGALKAYDEFATRIREEWAMEPSDKLKGLIEEVKQESTVVSEKSREPNATRDPDLRAGLSEPSRVSPQVPPESPIAVNAGKTIQKSTKFRWWGIAAIGLLLIAIAAGWMLWPGVPADSVPPAVSEQSVAVLPFTYLGDEDSTDYFSLGMTEEILSRLAQVSDLSVISRTSVMQYRDTEKSLREIAEELGVAAVVEGSVQQAGDRIRIHAQLIDAQTDWHLWGESYDRESKDILTIQNEVATRIAEALQAELLPQERAQLTARRDVREKAYHLYLRAQHLRDQRDSTGIFKAAMLFREAIENDSTFAPAYSGLAMAYFWSGLFGWIPRKKAGPEALQSAGRALALDSTIVEAHLAKALVDEIFQREWDQSEEAFKQGLKINPNHSELRSEYGWQLLRLGHIKEALIQMQRAVTVDPLSWHAHQSLGYAYYCNRQYEDAIQELETSIDIEPRFLTQQLYLFHALLKQSQRLFQQGLNEKAKAHLKRISQVWVNLGVSKKEMEALKLFEQVLRNKGQVEDILRRIDQDPVPLGKKMILYLFLGYDVKALDLIENMMSFDSVVYADPIFDAVREDPRFKQLVEQNLERDVELF